MITDALAPHAHDSTALLTATKACPGVLHLFTSLLAAFPAAPAADAASDGGDAAAEEDASVPARVVAPQIATPISASAQQHVLLSAAARLAFASLLPTPERVTWHLLFNSDMHGKSFASFYGRITCQGPSLVVVRPSTRVYPTTCMGYMHVIRSSPTSSCVHQPQSTVITRTPP